MDKIFSIWQREGGGGGGRWTGGGGGRAVCRIVEKEQKSRKVLVKLTSEGNMLKGECHKYGFGIFKNCFYFY